MNTVAGKIRDALQARLPEGRTLRDDSNFFESGITSRKLVSALAELHEAGLDVRMLDMYRFPNLRLLSEAIVQRIGERTARPGLPWEQD